MVKFQSALLFFAFALFFATPAQAQEPETSASSPKTWRMEITSTGGFHGLGDGGISLSSTGQASVNNLSKSCNVTLPTERFEKLSREFVDWELKMRNTRFDRSDAMTRLSLPIPCCDLIHYTFYMKSGTANLTFTHFSESWANHQTSSDGLETPKALRDGLFELRDALLNECSASR